MPMERRDSALRTYVFASLASPSISASRASENSNYRISEYVSCFSPRTDATRSFSDAALARIYGPSRRDERNSRIFYIRSSIKFPYNPPSIRINIFPGLRPCVDNIKIRNRARARPVVAITGANSTPSYSSSRDAYCRRAYCIPVESRSGRSVPIAYMEGKDARAHEILYSPPRSRSFSRA